MFPMHRSVSFRAGLAEEPARLEYDCPIRRTLTRSALKRAAMALRPDVSDLHVGHNRIIHH